MDIFNNRNNNIALGLILTTVIIGIITYINKTKVIEGFDEKNVGMTEKDIENTVNKVFSKLGQDLSSNEMVPDGTQGTKLKNNDRIGVVKWFNVSSKDRDLDKFPCAGKFVHNFDYKLWNVHSIELIRGSFPRSQYAIDVHNNKMDIEVNGIVLTVIEVGRGNYDINTYITALKAAFVSNGIDMNIVFSDLISRVEIYNTSVTDTYKILFKTGPNYEDSNFNELGFTPNDITLVPSGSKIGDRRVDLFGSVSINIELEEVPYNNGDHVMSTILLNECALTVYDNPALFSKRHLKPLLSLSHFTCIVTFNQAFKKKREYNFNGIDYDLTLEIITIEHAPSWQPYLHSYAPHV